MIWACDRSHIDYTDLLNLIEMKNVQIFLSSSSNRWWCEDNDEMNLTDGCSDVDNNDGEKNEVKVR